MKINPALDLHRVAEILVDTGESSPRRGADTAFTQRRLAESDLQARDRATDPSVREQHTRRATRRAAEALTLQVWTEIYWIFDDGTRPLSFAASLDPRCVDALLEFKS